MSMLTVSTEQYEDASETNSVMLIVNHDEFNPTYIKYNLRQSCLLLPNVLLQAQCYAHAHHLECHSTPI